MAGGSSPRGRTVFTVEEKKRGGKPLEKILATNPHTKVQERMKANELPMASMFSYATLSSWQILFSQM